MGTFDGWSEGENLSPEYDGSFTKFATTRLLLVDGGWQLSPKNTYLFRFFKKNSIQNKTQYKLRFLVEIHFVNH
jgi:hypothetical protein